LSAAPTLWQRIFRRTPPAPPMQRASAPIPFHMDRFVGIQRAGAPSAKALLEGADGIPAIAARAIADRIASLDLNVVVQRRARAGTVEEEVLDDHPLKRLLDAPSPTHSAVQTLRLIAQYVVTTGEAYLLKVGPGRIPQSLFLMLPDRVQPLAARGVINGYEVHAADGSRTQLRAEEVVRIWNPDPATLYTAKGVLGPQAVVADAVSFQQQHLRAHYETNAIPPVVIEGQSGANAPNKDERDRFDEKWLESYHRRLGLKRGLPAWIPPGWETKMLDAHGGDTEIAALMAFNRDLLFMAYGVPRSIVGDVVDANRAAAETNQYVFDRNTVQPICDLIADALTNQLAIDYPQQSGVRLLVRFADFVSADEDLRLKEEEQDLRLKVRSVNQVREDRGGDPVPWGELPVGSFADVPYTGEAREASPDPMQPEPFGALGSGDDAEDVQDEEDAPRTRDRAHRQRQEWTRYMARERRWTPTFTARMQKVFAKQRDSVLERLARQPRARIRLADLFDPSEWRRLFQVVMEPVRRAAFLASAQEALDTVAPGSRFIFTEAVKLKLEADGQVFFNLVNQTTGRRLSDVLADAAESGDSIDQIARSIREVFGVRRKQAVTIARTEMAGATQAAQIEGYAQSGVVERVEWGTSLDDAVRDSHQIDGQIVAVGTPFTLADGVTARAPGDPALPAEDRINCRCFVTALPD